MRPDHNSHAWYSLRRTLPPWRFEENLAELTEKLSEYRVDELIVKVDTEDFFHGHPPLEWLRSYQDNLFRIKREMERLGIVYSLNPWITLGHCDRGRDDRAKLPGLKTIVGHDGTEARHCACPLSKAWRQHFSELWTLYAQTEPGVMWVEDDIRTFNHAPVRFGCFCEQHMRRFSQLVGRAVTREELVGAMLAPGEPHPWRRLYLRLQAQIMIETAEWLGKTVHGISPQTCMGLMSSGPRQHCLEGRDWKRFAEALANGKTLYSRAPMGNYNEESLRGFYYSHDSIKLTRHALAHVRSVNEQTEVENVPFTRFSKSVNATFIQMALSFAFGSHGVTLNLYDHSGSPMEEEPEFGAMLGKNKAYFNSLAQVAQTQGDYRGVGLLFHPLESNVKNLAPASDFADLGGDGYPMMLALENAGIPTVYGPSTVYAGCGQTLRAMTDGEIEELLTGGLFLDAVAARILHERGYGDDIGIIEIDTPKSREHLPETISAEAYDNQVYGGSSRCYLTASLPTLNAEGKICRFKPLSGAETVSHWVDPDTLPIMPAMITYSNSRGGRVAIHGLDYHSTMAPAFHHPLRRRQLQNVISFLSGGKPEILVDCDGAFALGWRKICPNYNIIGVFNLSLDEWPVTIFNLKWEDNKPLPEVFGLKAEGSWSKIKNLELTQEKEGVLTIKVYRSVDFKLPLILCLK